MTGAMEMASVSMSTPGHVPAELVIDFDIYAPHRAGEDFFAAWRRFQDEAPGPVVWTPRNGGHWVAVRGTGVMKVYEDFERFSSDSFAVPVPEGGQQPLGAFTTDPPDHRQKREFISLGMSPKVVREKEPEIRSLAIALIDGLLERGTCDVVKDFADVLPLSIFLKLIDLPLEDRVMLARWVEDVVKAADLKVREEGFLNLAAYLQPVLDRRRGSDRADMIAKLANLKVNDAPLSPEETVGAAIHLVGAGLDTVASLLAFVLGFLARHPELRRELAEDPSKIDAAATEFIRRFPIVVMSRRVRADTTFEDALLKTNEMISAPTMLYNLDPEIYPDPLAFDLVRKQGKVATFGQGIHRCPGAILGRTELIIVLQEWLKRIPDFEIVDEGAIKVNGGVVAGIEGLDLRWARP